MTRNGKFRMRQVFLGVVGVLFLGGSVVVADTVTRKELEGLIAKRLRSTLMTHAIKHEPKEKSVQQVEAIVPQISRWVEKLPEQEISGQMAEWIMASFVDLVNHRGEVLLEDDNRARSLMDSLEAQSNKMFLSLDQEKSEALINRRNNLTKESEEFWDEMQSYVANRLSEPEVFRMSLGIDPAKGRVFKDFESLRRETTNSTLPNKVAEVQYNARLHEIDSRLLTLLLVREVVVVLRDQSTKNYFGTNNLFSRAYDVSVHEGILTPAKFDEMSGEIDGLYDRVVRVDGKIAELYMPDLQKFISTVKRVRWGDKIGDFPGDSCRAKGYIEFSNDPQLWQFLEIKLDTRGK